MFDDFDHIRGTVEKILFQNTDNGYSVCDIESEKGELITIVGILPYISVGESLDVYGSWTSHQIYGSQFKVEKYEKILPTDKNEILRYLSAGTVKGIGPKIAEKIVAQYGEDSFDVIANHPDWISQIKGISRAKALEMSADFKEKSGVREILLFCKDKFSPNMALKIYKKWGRNALGEIKENPYRLCSSINGISFKKADDIAKEIGIADDSEHRIESGIIYALEIFASRDGHTYVKKPHLTEAVGKLLEIEPYKIDTVLEKMKDKDDIKVVDYKDECHIYLKNLYFDEEFIAKKLSRINKTAFSIDRQNTYAFIEELEIRDNINYAPMQKKAIETALESGVTILTGGPGTGKTTIIKALLHIFDKLGLDCALCAPTGRASKRMSEATSNEAKTIHRLLEASAGSEYDEELVFMRDENNLLDEDVIIMDEASMADVPITASLLRAIKPGARIILIGDIYQLPSVGAGNVLNDIINSECFNVVRLTEIFRQSENSGIVYNAHKIHNGEHLNLAEKNDDFFFVCPNRAEDLPTYIANLCQNRLPKKYNVDALNGIQIITPSKKGFVGTYNLNNVMQKSLNPSSLYKKEITLSNDRVFREGDKVMQVKNNYDTEWVHKKERGTGVFNGDIGIIKEIDTEEELVTVDFDDRLVQYDKSMLDELELSYAITVHKSQGSEFPIVIIPLCSVPMMLQTRNLIYTAVTRASKIVLIVGEREILYNMIDNDTQISRNTGLKLFLRSINENN